MISRRNLVPHSRMKSTGHGNRAIKIKPRSCSDWLPSSSAAPLTLAFRSPFSWAFSHLSCLELSCLLYFMSSFLGLPWYFGGASEKREVVHWNLACLKIPVLIWCLKISILSDGAEGRRTLPWRLFAFRLLETWLRCHLNFHCCLEGAFEVIDFLIFCTCPVSSPLKLSLCPGVLDFHRNLPRYLSVLIHCARPGSGNFFYKGLCV